ncbi:hypothetical protein [Pollutibacter soli]|uniref:hypothetical protein n=1 Tax=Pollutibacter soli TaxID=3034157 RepID=UPI003013C515
MSAKKYFIEEGEVFDPVNFPYVLSEIKKIKERTDRLPPVFKSEILISYLKEHTLQGNWIKMNKVLTDLVISEMLFEGTIESLFDSSRNHPGFREGLENYLKLRFASSQS